MLFILSNGMMDKVVCAQSCVCLFVCAPCSIATLWNNRLIKLHSSRLYCHGNRRQNDSNIAHSEL